MQRRARQTAKQGACSGQLQLTYGYGWFTVMAVIKSNNKSEHFVSLFDHLFSSLLVYTHKSEKMAHETLKEEAQIAHIREDKN